jgi:hypothetical protein
VNEYGFVCLQSVTGKGDARKLFEAMDANGGGVVLLDEFCKYLKACEVDAYNRITLIGFPRRRRRGGGVG